jgi:hypothetical protein
LKVVLPWLSASRCFYAARPPAAFLDDPVERHLAGAAGS